MTTDEIAAAYQALIREKYPRVIVTPDMHGTPHDDIFDAYFIPDDRLVDYMNDWLDTWFNEAQSRGLPKVTIVPIPESATRQFYLEKLRANGYLDEFPTPAELVNAGSAK